MFTQINFTRTLGNAQMPARATNGAAGFDLTSAQVALEGNIFVVNTGLTTSFSRDFVMLIYPRSGLARRLGLHLVNGVGVIDSDYRGEIKLMFRTSEADVKHSEIMEALRPGNRVAQALITQMPVVAWSEVIHHEDSYRGTGGFGSTGHN